MPQIPFSVPNWGKYTERQDFLSLKEKSFKCKSAAGLLAQVCPVDPVVTCMEIHVTEGETGLREKPLRK